MLPGEAPPGRGAPGLAAPGRGGWGRGMGRSTGCADENGLLPTRGRPAGLGIGPGAGRAPPGSPGGWAGADGCPSGWRRGRGRGASATAAAGAGAAGAGTARGRTGFGRRTGCRTVADRLVEGFVEGSIQSVAGRPLRSPGGGLGGRRLAAAKRLTQPASHRSLYRRRRGFNEFALFIQPGEHIFTADTEFFSQLVYAGLTCHYISCLGGDGSGPRLGFSYDAWSS